MNRAAKTTATAPVPLRGTAATLRSRCAGSQDELRCGAIHKFKGDANGDAPVAKIAPHSLKAMPRKPNRRHPSTPRCGRSCGGQDLGMNRVATRFTNSKPTSTAARFDKTEPAATKPNATSTAVLENVDARASWGAASSAPTSKIKIARLKSRRPLQSQRLSKVKGKSTGPSIPVARIRSISLRHALGFPFLPAHGLA